MKQRIILTADDYGFCDQVDKGILKAASAGYITSVAAFSNGPNFEDRLEALKKARDENKGFDVGCHLTITSGRPLTEEISKQEYQFVNHNGYFLHYGDLKFPRLSEKENKIRLSILEEELEAQILRMQRFVKVTNLSSHHNTLTFHLYYMKALINVSIKMNIPIRSYKILPGWKEWLYQAQWRVRLRGENEQSRIREIRKFFKKIEDHAEKLKSDYLTAGKKFPYSPNGINGKNYVLPPPPLTKFIDDDLHNQKARKQSRKTFRRMKFFERDGVEEYCFHLCDQNEWQIDDLTFHFASINGEQNKDYYPGVTAQYFEGRRIEMLSLPELYKRVGKRKAKGKRVPEFIKWSDIKSL